MDEKNLIDDCFYIEKARWDVYHSYDKEQKRIITSLTEEGCINATRYYLKSKQENKFRSESTKCRQIYEYEVQKLSGVL